MDGFVFDERSMSPATSWLVLIVAGLFEVGWAIGLKYTEGFTRLWPTLWTAATLVISMALLGAGLVALAVLLSTLPFFGGIGLGWSLVMLIGSVLVGVRELHAAGRSLPEPMMHAVADLCRLNETRCVVSLETPMACGIGICFSCVAKVRQSDGAWDWKRTCVEGPIFDADRIEW